MPAVTAAGAAVWRRSASGELEVAVVYRPGHDDWSLPKGKSRAGEALPVTAVREVAEETGYTVTLGPRLGSSHYQVAEGPKVAHFWAARLTGGCFRPSEEVGELRWLSLAKASEVLSYQRDRVLLAGLRSASAVTATVLLVRHGEAGQRETWSGDDHLRSLTDAGRAQAEALRTLLPLFGAARVYSAPPWRCRQSVEGLAADLGVPIITEPRLSEPEYRANPAAGRQRLIEIAAEPGGPAVVCSQGGVIPDLVRALTDSAGLTLLDVPSRKGSYWGLFFTSSSPMLPVLPVLPIPPVLLSADYYDDALLGVTSPY